MLTARGSTVLTARESPAGAAAAGAQSASTTRLPVCVDRCALPNEHANISSPTLRAWFHLVTGDAANHDACFSLISQSPSPTSSALSDAPKQGEGGVGARRRCNPVWAGLRPAHTRSGSMRLPSSCSGAFQNLRVFVPLCELLRTVSSVKAIGKPLTYGVVRSCTAHCSARFLSDRLSRPAECVRISVLLAEAPDGEVSVLWDRIVRCCC